MGVAAVEAAAIAEIAAAADVAGKSVPAFFSLPLTTAVELFAAFEPPCNVRLAASCESFWRSQLSLPRNLTPQPTRVLTARAARIAQERLRRT